MFEIRVLGKVSQTNFPACIFFLLALSPCFIQRFHKPIENKMKLKQLESLLGDLQQFSNPKVLSIARKPQRTLTHFVQKSYTDEDFV